MKYLVISNGTVVEVIDEGCGYTTEDYRCDCTANGWEFAPCDKDSNITVVPVQHIM